jgi:RNA-binding protein
MLFRMTKRKASDPGPAPTKTDRREFLKRGHGLKARLAVGRGGLTDAFLLQVRAAFVNTDLLKVRLEADTGDEADLLAEELAKQVPCYLVQRVGRVALIYRKQMEEA